MKPTNHILIVEDDPDIRESFIEFLESEGYVVFSARNGREALRYLEQVQEVDLVFLDLMMPVMNGWEFLAAIQMQCPPFKTPPIVVVSATADTQNLLKNQEIKAVLPKPFNLEKALALAKQYCSPKILN